MKKETGFCVLLLLLLLGGGANAQTADEQEYNKEKVLVKKFCYFDSAQTFLHGSKAITLAKKINKPYLEADILLCYANYFFFQTNYKKAAYYYSNAETIANRYQNDTLRNIIRVKFAFIEHELGNWSKSRIIYEEVIRDATRTKDTSALLEAYNGFANLKERQNKDKEALELYNKALKIADRSAKKYQFAYLLNNRALLKMKLNFNEAARVDLMQALELSRVDRLTGNILNNIGLIYMNKQNYDSAFIYFDKFYTLAKKAGVPEGLVVGLINISQLKSQKGNHDEAIRDCDSALKLVEQHQMIYHKAKILNGLALLYIRKKNYQKALELAEQSLEATKITGSLEDFSGSWSIKSQAYDSLNDFKNAYEAQKNFKLFSDSLNNLSAKKALSEISVQYEVEQKEKAIQEGKNQLALKEKEDELKSSRYRLIILILAGITLIGLGVIYIRYQRIRRKQQEEFSRKLMEGIEDERSRIAKELHDDIGANLSIVKNKIYLNTEKGDRELFTQLNNDVSQVIEQTRGISHQLYPSYLYKLSLTEAITHFLNRVERDTGISVNTQLQENLEKYITENSKLHIFRIVQELVNNTIKHAHASEISLLLKHTAKGQIEMEYTDNGDGLKTGKTDGMGMISIKERVKILNGKMKIDAENDKGFKISFIFSVED